MKLVFKCLAQCLGFLVLVVFLLLGVLHWYQPKLHPVVLPEPKPVAGAALFYNQAIAAMPHLTADEKKVVSSEEPDPETARAILAKWDACLQLTAHGAALRECEWGVDLTTIEGTQVIPTVKVFTLCQMLAMRIQMHFQNHEASKAVDDILTILRLSRHVGSGSFFAERLVEIREEMIAMTSVTCHLQQFDPASLHRLREGIETLPPSRPMKETIATETACWSAWVHNILTNALLDRRDPHRASVKKTQFSEPNQEYTITSGLPAKYLVYSLHHFDRKREELNRLMELPYAEARPRLEAFQKEVASYRWFGGVYMIGIPEAPSALLKDQQMQTLWRLFTVALDTQLRDPGQLRVELSKALDLFDGKPVTLRDTDDGVEIVLNLGEGKKPMRLFIQLPQK